MLQSVQLVDPDSRFCFAILHLLEGRIAPGCVTDIAGRVNALHGSMGRKETADTYSGCGKHEKR